MIRKLPQVLASAILCLILCSPAFAFRLQYFPGSPEPLTWFADSAHMRVSTTGFSYSVRRQTIADVVSAWNDTPSRFSFGVSFFDSSVGFANGQNEMWFEKNAFLVSGLPAVTYLTFDTQHFHEADILFNNHEYSWNSTTTYRAGRYSVSAAATHELGHVLGLEHEERTYNIMGDASTHCSIHEDEQFFYPGEDATHGAVDLYSLDSVPGQDVGVAPWNYSGSTQSAFGQPGYSLHRRAKVEIRNRVGNYVEAEIDGGYVVEAGDTIRVTFAFENNGTTSQRPRVYYLLSDDDTITLSDTLLATARPTVRRNTVYERQQTLTLPANLSAGDYSLGVYLSPGVSEFNPNNNRTFVVITVAD